MANPGQNPKNDLIDFGDEGGKSPKSTKAPVEMVTSPAKDATKPSKSYFEITSVESGKGESRDNDGDSEFDDTLSEANFDRSPTPLTPASPEHRPIGKPEPVKQQHSVGTQCQCIPNTFTTTTISSVQAASAATPAPLAAVTATATTVSNTRTSTSAPASTTSAETNPTSRFRIVKIAKSEPFDRGRWRCSDTSQSQNQSSSTNNQPTATTTATTDLKTIDETPSSPHIHKGRLPSTAHGSNDSDKNSDKMSLKLRSPTESRTGYTDPNDAAIVAATPVVVPVVEALDTALGQIQEIKESLIMSVTHEMKTLKERLKEVEAENQRLSEENRALKERCRSQEVQISTLNLQINERS